MAAYASLVSLTHILHKILHPPPVTQITIPRQQIESLQEKIYSLLDFLESHWSLLRREEAEALEKKIAEAAYAAEDIIESHVVSQIREKYPIDGHQRIGVKGVKGVHAILRKLGKMKMTSKNEIPRVINKFKLIEKELTRFSIEELQSCNSHIGNASTQPALIREDHTTMVGFEEQLLQVMSALSTYESRRMIIPIVGMGGIGKTTLATNIFNNPTIKEYFPFRAWVIVSQVYTERDILLGLLHHISNVYTSGEKKSDDQVGELLYKALFGRKYLIVMDDVWDIGAWDKVKRFLPVNNNGSRILITTRLSNLALDFGSCSRPYEMKFLDDAQSWDLLREMVFAKLDCPVEMVGVGKSIAKRCGGLPLALVVTGGLLANSKMRREYWESVEANMGSAMNYGNDDQCMKILSLSYSHLPIYIKPCFLYLSVFPADFAVGVSKLIKLWVSEGFIRRTSDKILEETAEEYLEELINRNLVLVCERGSSGKSKSCSIHHIIWDVCRREAKKDKFLHIEKFDGPNVSSHIERERRISIQPRRREEKLGNPLLIAPQNRSLLSNLYWDSRSITRKFILLRVLDVVDFYSIEELLHLTNTRYVACAMDLSLKSSSRSSPLWNSISRLWNLETLVVDGEVSLPLQIWQMPRLRHLKMGRLTLRDPAHQDFIVLENLQTLSTVLNLRCTNHVIRRIPNLKKLRITYSYSITSFGTHYLSNLVHLDKLESLGIRGDEELYGNINFPLSPRKLTLENCLIPWEDISMVGSLPNLEVLKLRTNAAKGREWNPIEGEFCRLKFLLIHGCELETWEAEHIHFPILEQLHLRRLMLKKIPMAFAEILTLQVIDLKHCSSLLERSAAEISEERESLGYDGFQLRLNPSKISLSQEYIVGLEDEADTLVKHLTVESKDLDVISITGMPGFGKTTLAWKIYHDPRIRHKFSTVIWVNVSQEFNMKKVFLSILKRLTEVDMSALTEPELAQKVRFYLMNQAFLLFMDDIWAAEAWESIEKALPKSNRMGKVVMTSRDEMVAKKANHLREPHKLHVQDSKESWELLQLKVFGKLDECPPELEEMGSVIARQCEGVPLAIVVMAGILVEKYPKIGEMRNQWEEISGRLSMYVRYDTVVENIIALSYDQLPHHLRDCFLYLGVFPDNYEIPVWKLIRLWIAEGFINKKPDMSLEDVAEDYIKDLVKRNLVLVHKTTGSGVVKTCRFHDMIRDFCNNEASNSKHNLFQQVCKSMSLSGIRSCRRLCIHSNVMDFLRKKPKGPLVASFLCFPKQALTLPPESASSIHDAFNLLRVLDVNSIKFIKFPTKLTQLTHLRYITLSCHNLKAIPKSIVELWDLQTIRVDTTSRTLDMEADIWNMMQLRHLKAKAAIIINKQVKGEAGENLQTLSMLSADCCTSDVFKRAFNLKELGIRGQLKTVLDSNLKQLVCLQKLTLIHDVYPDVNCLNPLPRLPRAERFPPNLKILKLSSTFLGWDHMPTLGMLHNLQVLKLKDNAFVGKFWNVSGGGFHSLELLHIEHTDLESWAAVGNPCPKLRCLVLKKCKELQEIPFVLVKSLDMLELERVPESVVDIGRKMEVEKQQMQGQQRGQRERFRLVMNDN